MKNVGGVNIDEADAGIKSWYIEAVPWKDCPFKLNAVVVTKKGQEFAIKYFKDMYKNDSIEVSDIHEIAIMNGDLDDLRKEKLN